MMMIGSSALAEILVGACVAPPGAMESRGDGRVRDAALR
jgi:hypothetical protein